MKTKILILFAACSLALNTNINSQTLPGEIEGTVRDEEGEPLPFASVSYRINGALQAVAADENGHYRIRPLDAGKYDVTFSFIGCRTETQTGVQVNSGRMTSLSVKLANNTLPPIDIVHHKHLFEKDETMRVNFLDTEEIENAMVTDLKDLAALTADANQSDDGQDVHIRGSRSDATQYYVDGVKMIGSFSIPKSSIKEISVISGGVPAMFGDATGGIVLITTKSHWDNN